MAPPCGDGTICENSAPCVPHPREEGSYMCDCAAAGGSSVGAVAFAGVYCEHAATSYCRWASDVTRRVSAQSFCVNSGECKRTVGVNDDHAGCDCPEGYEGDFCQFVEGSTPREWTMDSFMHPRLIESYAQRDNSYAPLFRELGYILSLLIFIHIFLCLCFCCGGTFEHSSNMLGGKSPSDEFEPDGGVLKEAQDETAERDGEASGEAPGERTVRDLDKNKFNGMPGQLLDTGVLEIV